MEQLLAYRAREESLKPWLEEQIINDLYVADLKLSLRRDMAKVWSVRDEDPMEAAATIVVVEGWCLRHLIYLKGQRWSTLNCKWTASLNEALRFLHIGQLVNNGLFKKWVKGHRHDFEHNITSWKMSFFEEFHRPGIRLKKLLRSGQNSDAECGSGSGRSTISDIYAYVACVCVDR